MKSVQLIGRMSVPGEDHENENVYCKQSKLR